MPNSQPISVFHAIVLPETTPVGYIAIMMEHNLSVPLPDFLCAIGKKHKQYTEDQWRIFTPRHAPKKTLYANLIFALKYEGVDHWSYRVCRQPPCGIVAGKECSSFGDLSMAKQDGES